MSQNYGPEFKKIAFLKKAAAFFAKEIGQRITGLLTNTMKNSAPAGCRSVAASITDSHITSNLAVRTQQKAFDSQRPADPAQGPGELVYTEGFHRVL